jgi:hypothetical protein
MFPSSHGFRSLLLSGLAAVPFIAQGQVSEMEPNNSCAEAQDMGSPPPFFLIDASLDTLNGVPDIDFFRFTAVPDTLLSIRDFGASVGAGTLPDPLLGLFDSACNLLMAVDDTIGPNPVLVFHVPEDGVFVIAATASPDFDFVGIGEGSYRLGLAVVQTVSAISGQLLSARDGTPLTGDRGAYVSLFRCVSGDCQLQVGFQATDDQGYFRFESDFVSLPLTAGDYQIRADASGFESYVGEIFTAQGGAPFDVGPIALMPMNLISSVTGRLVDGITHAPLPGVAPPFAAVSLERCDLSTCYTVAYAQANGLGEFRFDGQIFLIQPGAFRITAFADDYKLTTTSQFSVAAFEDYAAGTIVVIPFPIEFGAVQGCEIPPGGGLCEYQIVLRNRGPGRYRGEAWSTVDYFANEYPYRNTRFQVGSIGIAWPAPEPVNLRPGESMPLRFQFYVPGNVPEFSSICATATVGTGLTPQFHNQGDRFVFCTSKQAGTFDPLPEKEGRRRLRELIERRDALDTLHDRNDGRCTLPRQCGGRQ